MRWYWDGINLHATHEYGEIVLTSRSGHQADKGAKLMVSATEDNDEMMAQVIALSAGELVNPVGPEFAQ